MENARPHKVKTSALEPRRHHITLDLFNDAPPAIVAAVYPTSGTRPDEALQALLTGPQNQADYINGWRLAAYIKELEYLGWAFIKRDIMRPGCRREITEYTLDRQDASTSAALAQRNRQCGFIAPHLLGLLAVAVPAVVVLGSVVVGWLS